MGKLYYIQGKPHRIRRGKLVAIPDDWFGITCHATHRRKRDAFARRLGGVKDAQGTGRTAARIHVETRGQDKPTRSDHWKGVHRPYNRDGRSKQIQQRLQEEE